GPAGHQDRGRQGAGERDDGREPAGEPSKPGPARRDQVRPRGPPRLRLGARLRGRAESRPGERRHVLPRLGAALRRGPGELDPRLRTTDPPRPPAPQAPLGGLAGPVTTREIVLLSGGLDSATCLLIAKKEVQEVFALSFDYGQRHRLELDRARRLA